MAIPKKGSRNIIVNGEPYRWLIRRKATYSQTDYGIGKLHLAVEHAVHSGSVLIIGTNRPHPKDWSTEKVVPITPNDVEKLINKAINSGWQPKLSGSQFRYDELAE